MEYTQSLMEPDNREPERQAGDPGGWVGGKLAFEPDAAQARALRSQSKRGLLNCSRQWGKSTVTAAKAVHQAFTVAKSLTLVVSPSARHSGEFIRKERAGGRAGMGTDSRSRWSSPTGRGWWACRETKRRSGDFRRSRCCWWTGVDLGQ